MYVKSCILYKNRTVYTVIICIPAMQRDARIGVKNSLDHSFTIPSLSTQFRTVFFKCTLMFPPISSICVFSPFFSCHFCSWTPLTDCFSGRKTEEPRSRLSNTNACLLWCILLVTITCSNNILLTRVHVRHLANQEQQSYFY